MEKFDKPYFEFTNEEIDLKCFRSETAKVSVEPLQNTRSTVISFCLENNFFIRPHVAAEGSFLVSKNSGAVAVQDGPSFLLQIHTDKEYENSNGLINPSVMKTILELIDNKNHNALVTSTKINWLLEQTFAGKRETYISFHDAEAIYKTIKALDDSDKIFTTDEVIKKSGIKKYRFQKGCMQLYGVSLKEILYERSMKMAVQLLVEENKPAEEISRMLGYNSHENFITGFKKYFDTTPLVMQKFIGIL